MAIPKQIPDCRENVFVVVINYENASSKEDILKAGFLLQGRDYLVHSASFIEDGAIEWMVEPHTGNPAECEEDHARSLQMLLKALEEFSQIPGSKIKCAGWISPGTGGVSGGT